MDIDGRREDWLQRVRALREAGAIDDADEHALIRQYDERAQRLREELAKLVPEYRRRLSRDGEAPENRWLADIAEAMGRRDGEETRQALAALERRA